MTRFSKTDISPNNKGHRGRRHPPTHIQNKFNTTRDRQIYLDQDRQQSHSHLQLTHRTEQIHQYPTNTGDQHYMTQNLAYNTRQNYQAPTLYQLQNPIVSQQQSHNNVWTSWQNFAPNPQTPLQIQLPQIQNQQVPLTHNKEL